MQVAPACTGVGSSRGDRVSLRAGTSSKGANSLGARRVAGPGGTVVPGPRAEGGDAVGPGSASTGTALLGEPDTAVGGDMGAGDALVEGGAPPAVDCVSSRSTGLGAASGIARALATTPDAVLGRSPVWGRCLGPAAARRTVEAMAARRCKGLPGFKATSSLQHKRGEGRGGGLQANHTPSVHRHTDQQETINE